MEHLGFSDELVVYLLILAFAVAWFSLPTWTRGKKEITVAETRPEP